MRTGNTQNPTYPYYYYGIMRSKPFPVNVNSPGLFYQAHRISKGRFRWISQIFSVLLSWVSRLFSNRTELLCLWNTDGRFSLIFHPNIKFRIIQGTHSKHAWLLLRSQYYVVAYLKFYYGIQELKLHRLLNLTEYEEDIR